MGFDLSPSTLMAGLVFGAFGIYFFREGKTAGNLWGMLIGAALLVFPYVVTDAIWVWVVGAALMFIGFRNK